METPGQILKRERETSGTTLKEIASITRIPVSALKNLEEDRYDLFPAEVFAKGFLRNYCRELHVDVDEVMLAYNTLKQQQRRQEPSESVSSSSSSIPVTPAATVETSAPRQRKRVDPVTPLILSAPEGESASGSAAVDSSQRTFRFAYLIVFLVVATSLGLSVLFTGTGEAEENEKRRVRPAVEADADTGSRWLTDDDSTLSAQPDDTDEPAALTPETETDAQPTNDNSVDSWSRPAFPEDDQAQ